MKLSEGMIFVALINAIAKRRLKKLRTSHLQKLNMVEFC